MGGAGCFGEFAARLLKLYVPYVACTADLIVHQHIKEGICIIKGSQIREFIILQLTRRAEGIVVRIGRRLADPVELYTVSSGTVHIKVRQIGGFIALLHARITQAAEEIEFNSSRILQLLHPLGQIQDLRRHLIAQSRLQIPYEIVILHFLEVEIEAYPRVIIAVIHGEKILITALRITSHRPLSADLAVFLVIFKHFHRIGFAVVAKNLPEIAAECHTDIKISRIEKAAAVHMTAPRTGSGKGIVYTEMNIFGCVNGKSGC